MPTFAGVDHLALTVTDLDRSERFYVEVLDFTPVLDWGDGRICIHRGTGFTLGLVRHPAATGARFSELHTGLDHLGLVAADRDELEAWERRFDARGVTYTPIREMPLGWHLNFRDPDDIPLELYTPNEVMADALAQLRDRELSRAEIDAFVATHLGVMRDGGSETLPKRSREPEETVDKSEKPD